MSVSSKAEAVGELINMQAVWDRRKTKQDTEERSLQEAGQAVFMKIQNALSEKMEGEAWKKAASQIGGCLKTLCRMLDAQDCGVDVGNYPRVMYETKREEPDMAEQQSHDVVRNQIQANQEGEQQQTEVEAEQGEDHVDGGNNTSHHTRERLLQQGSPTVIR